MRRTLTSAGTPAFALLLSWLIFSPSPGARAGDFGGEMKVVEHLETGACIDLALHRSHLWFIGDETLFCADISHPKKPKIISTLRGLGKVRQIECEGDHAFIVSREDGLFVVNIADPAAPRVVYHYDTLEKATGIAVSPPVAAVANRYHGVELIDISDPASPRYLSTFLHAKEIQSIEIRGNLLVATAWGSRELFVADISDLLQPRVIGRADLDGYGDGVRVRGNVAFVSTGHHSAALGSKPHFLPGGPEDEGYGEGHGLEIFDLSDPSAPARLSVSKLPPFYDGYPDMWNADISGSVAVLSDTYNGIFALDVSDPSAPRFIGRLQLPVSGNKPEPSAAAVLGDKVLYMAGYKSGLYVVDCPETKRETRPRGTEAALTKPSRRAKEILRESGELRYRPEGQVRSVCLADKDRAVLAVGNGGIHVVQLAPEFKVLSETPTGNIVLDVAVRGNELFVAEMTGGVSVWTITPDGKIRLRGSHFRPDLSAHQVVVMNPGPYAMIQNGPLLEILDVSDPEKIHSVLSWRGPGLFYEKWISTTLSEGRYGVAFWHSGGPVWFDLSEPVRRLTEFADVDRNYLSGLCVMEDGSLLILHGEGMSIFPSLASPRLGEPQARLPDGTPLNGIPSARGNILVTSVGAWRSLKAVDISDPMNPRLLEKWNSQGHPSRVVFWQDKLLIPEGREGLVVVQKEYLRP